MDQEDPMTDQFVIEHLQNLLLEYSEPYVVKRARECQTQDYESEFFVGLEQIAKNEECISNLIQLCMVILDKAQQRAFEREEEFAQNEEQINQLQERLNFEQKNSKQFQKMLKEESLKVKEQLEIIQQLEQQITDKDNQIMILQVNTKHRESNAPKKQDRQEFLANNKTIEDLKNQLSNYKKEVNQAQVKVDEYKQQFQRQSTELEDTLNEIQVLKMEKIRSDSKIKFLEQEIVKLNQIILEQEQKCQVFDFKIAQLNQQLYDLLNSSGCKNQENDLTGSTFQRNSLQTSNFQFQNQQTASFNNQNSMVNNTLNSNLKSDLPELSYRQPIPSQFSEIGAINEVPETQEQSVQHSKKNTQIPSEFINNQNFDLQKLEEKLQKLATPRQVATPRVQQSVTPRSLVPKAVQESQDLRTAKLQEKLKQSQLAIASPRIPKLELKQPEDNQLKQLQQEPQPITIRNEIEIGSITEEDYDTFFYEQKVKTPQVKKQQQFKIPPLSIFAQTPPDQQQEKEKPQEPPQKQQTKQSAQAINHPLQPRSSNAPQKVYKEIYTANETYFINMKQEQNRIIPQLDRTMRQSLVVTNAGQKQVVKRDPYKEFFDLLCQCVKLNSEYFDEIVYIDTNNYYQECMKSGKPFNEWEDWIRNRLESQIDIQD